MSALALKTMLLTSSGSWLAQTAPVSPQLPDAMTIHSVWDFVVKGGWTMGAIAACSLLALTVIVERAILLRRGGVLPPRFLSSLSAVAADRASALQLCESDGSPVARVLGAIIRKRGRSPEIVEKAVRDAGTRVLVSLRQRMRLLSVLPQVSTMLGLLGTIFGMIKTFQAVAASGQNLGKAELLAKGIFEAWTNTAAGLLVAIPVLITYHILMGRVDLMAVELDRVAAEWMENDGSPPVSPRAALEPPVVAAQTLAPSGVGLAMGT